MAAADNSVIVSGITKSFGDVHALRDVSFEVGPGEVLALLGPNGAGKTTMVDILSTLTRPDRGHASIAGFDVESDPASVRRSIMLTGQQVALDEMLTGRENLVLFGRLQGLSKSNARSRAEELLRQGVVGFGELSIEHLSLPQSPVKDYEYAPADSPLMLLLADIAAQHNVPIDLHMEALPQPITRTIHADYG